VNPLDWLLVLSPFVIVLTVGLYARKQVRSVADFMSGNRSAGRYLLAIASGELQTGAAIFAAQFEMISRAGFTMSWWWWLSTPAMLLVGISGFVTYRYRETRAMTLAQFFEIRYNKSIRLFTGILGFFAGICNFGIIPAVGARCLVYFLGLPLQVSIFSFSIPSYIILMGIFLSVALFVALTGGVVTIILTNCLEGILSQLFYLLIIFSLIRIFPWSQINATLTNRPPGQSMLNPFDTSGVGDFNLWYVLMGIAVAIYGTMAWQNSGAYNSAAFSPHEGRMGIILGRCREMGKGAVVTLLGICAFTFLNHPAFAPQAGAAQTAIQQISDSHLQTQMRAPIALAHMLPPGIKGVFCVILLMGIFGGDATHLHSWGSIFVQDVLVPLRKKPFGPRQHLWVLRMAITGVAVFAFVFGSLFRQTDYILMWWAVTQAIYTGGAGAAIIGGLYWKKGTAAGACCGLITGSVLSVGGILLQRAYGSHPFLNGVQISFVATLASVAVYVLVSLLTHREDFNMDRMLHRGAYAAKQPAAAVFPVAGKAPGWLGRLIGFDRNFTRGDKLIAGILFSWSILFFCISIIGTLWNSIAPWPISVWSTFWKVVGLALPIFFAVVTGVWFTWGGIKDIRDLFRRLNKERVNPLDDGTVVNHQNLSETVVPGSAHEVVGSNV
jgi:SSS family solute:Na+ symporter